MTPRQRLARIAVDRGGLLGVAALAAYLALATPHIVDGDNAEYSTLGAIGGVPHPTGYPLYMLWLRLMSWLPGTTAAHTASLATALIGAACVVVLHAACRAWGARPLAATVAVAMFAASPWILRLATQAEVFALNDLVAATVLWLAASAGPLRGVWRAGALGLVAGLGLSDHVTCILVAPVGILGVVRALRELRATAPTLRPIKYLPIAIGASVAGLAVGLLPYAYLVSTAENQASWGQHVDGLHAVVRHFLRDDYGGPGAFAPDPQPIPMTDNLLALARMLGRTWLWGPLALGAVALVGRLRRSSAGEPRWGWAMLAASFAIAGPLLVVRFDVTHEGPGLYVIQRFFLLPALVLAIPIAAGIDRVLERGGERVASRRWLGTGLAVGAFIAIVGTSLPYLESAHSAAVEQGVRNMLHALPQDAVAIVYEDDLNFGADYVQLIRGERRDVTVAMSTAVGLPGVRERLERRLGIGFPTPRPRRLGVAFATAVLSTGRSVFVDALATDILAELPHYPYGVLFRVLPRGTALPSPQDVLALNQALYAKFEFGYAVPPIDADWPVHVHVRYVQMWQLIGDALTAEGLRDDAEVAYQLGRALVPR